MKQRTSPTGNICGVETRQGLSSNTAGEMLEVRKMDERGFVGAGGRVHAHCPLRNA